MRNIQKGRFYLKKDGVILDDSSPGPSSHYIPEYFWVFVLKCIMCVAVLQQHCENLIRTCAIVVLRNTSAIENRLRNDHERLYCVSVN